MAVYTTVTMNRMAVPASAIWPNSMASLSLRLLPFFCLRVLRGRFALRDHGQRALLGQLADVLGDPHRAELGAAHGAEPCRLEHLLRQGLVVHGPGGFRVQRQLELAVPVELEAGLRQLVVAAASALAAAGD